MRHLFRPETLLFLSGLCVFTTVIYADENQAAAGGGAAGFGALAGLLFLSATLTHLKDRD
jgi:hypothetical protein